MIQHSLSTKEEEQRSIAEGSVFLQRMMPHLLRGMAFEDAGKAVLNRDRELAQIAMEESEAGQTLRAELARQVYQTVRDKTAGERQHLNAVEDARRQAVLRVENDIRK